MNIELKNFDNLTADEKKTFEKLVEKANKTKGFVPEIDQDYYIIRSNGNLMHSTRTQWDLDSYMNNIVQLGNCFETKEQAKFALEKQRLYIELKQYALINNEDTIDWNNPETTKYTITYSHSDNGLHIAKYINIKHINQIYFTSEEIAKNAINEIGEDRIKKYLFEVVEK